MQEFAPPDENYENHESLPRRRFLKLAIAGLNGLIALALTVPGVGYLLTPVLRTGAGAWVKLGGLSALKATQPQKATFTYLSEEGYVSREKKGFVWAVADDASPEGLTVFSAVCSHTGCNVAWHADEDHFVCPCHEGRYDREGNVVSGPPPRPLQKLPLKIEGDTVSIQLPA